MYTLLLGDRGEKKGEMGMVQEVKRDRGWIVRLIRDGTRTEAVSKAVWKTCVRDES